MASHESLANGQAKPLGILLLVILLGASQRRRTTSGGSAFLRRSPMVATSRPVYSGRVARDSVVADGSEAKSFAGRILSGSSGKSVTYSTAEVSSSGHSQCHVVARICPDTDAFRQTHQDKETLTKRIWARSQTRSSFLDVHPMFFLRIFHYKIIIVNSKIHSFYYHDGSRYIS